ncbi:MAG: chromosomal replication initiator protein DnaA [Pseudomonadota bacterium]
MNADLSHLWSKCLERLEREISLEELNTWLRPLIAQTGENSTVRLLAPNDFVSERVNQKYLELIRDFFAAHEFARESVDVVVGQSVAGETRALASAQKRVNGFASGLDDRFRFDNFVLGKSNELGFAAAQQVARNPGKEYNPLLLYGGTGLGKTHLLHAIGQTLASQSDDRKVVYLHSEKFVSEMIKALRHTSIDAFKARYRSVDALLIDDIQFFAGKDRSQEEFFHTFNALIEARQQIILTCDRYPKEVEGLETRLRSRFGWGLSVPIEPPDFETRVAILLKKAGEAGFELNEAVAMLIARHIRSNVRDLEGALNSLIAHSRFSARAIDEEYTREILRDVLAVHDRQISLENIQKEVAAYYQLRISDLLSKRRMQSIARPRQMAMFLAKALTQHSLPEIGDAFGGRDHTTVLYACRKIEELCKENAQLSEDRARLMRRLSV